MEIGILLICVGRYNVFFEDLYKTCEKYFLPNYKKTYYVFTDGDIMGGENIKVFPQENLGWPNNTMMRFEMFNRINEKLYDKEYLFFLNVNMLFVDFIGDEVLPGDENNYLVGVSHPGYYNKSINEYPYERRSESSLSIPFNIGTHYFQGCFNGGKTNKFLEMSNILNEKINEDIRNNITPIYHDESALNWYFLDKNPLVMDCGYAYPSNIDVPF